MKSPEVYQSPFSGQIARNTGGVRRSSLSIASDAFIFFSGAVAALLLVWTFSTFSNPQPQTPHTHSFETPVSDPKPSVSSVSVTDDVCAVNSNGLNFRYDPPDPNFYDDPTLGYTIDTPIKNWDEKRQEWLKQHPSFASGSEQRVVMVTGSQSGPCKNPIGDHLLLRFYKNKADYCRIHGYDIFYNNVLLHPQMHTFWAKIPAVKAAMLAHPESEWIWWVDSDAAFTDMDFKIPLQRYKNHNFVVHGWPKLVYEKKSWTSLNAGVFLIRNSQWALDFMDVWAGMGPQTPSYEKWGEILRETCKDKAFPESDDQTGLVYLLLKEKEKWGDKIYVEGEYYFEGYWLEIVETLDNITAIYNNIERKVRSLRRRHGEKVSESYAAQWEPYLKDAGYGKFSWRRPFITHFTGCQPCSGKHNQMYSGQSCWDAMQKVLNFADNQVLRNYGFVHRDLLDSASVSPLPFDYPA
ncbi:putative xyloglucan 6-xylosyltransferase [Helianthus anomalus]